MTLTLAQLTRHCAIDVLDHLELEVVIPVLDGLQAQGDLIVIPFAQAAGVAIATRADWREVPRSGIDLLRGGAGGNTHTLVADERTALWTAEVRDPERLAIGAVRASRPVYLIHPEHGGAGIAAGTFLIRRQRQATVRRSGGWSARSEVELVAD